MDIHLKKLLKTQNWKQISLEHDIDLLVTELSFKDCMRIAYNLAYGYGLEEELQEYAIKLLLRIKDHFPQEWNSSWRNDAFLGNAYKVFFKEDEGRYYAYKRAYDKVDDPSPGLLLALAGCDYIPDKRFFSLDEAAHLLHRALEKDLYFNAICRLRLYYKNKNQKEKYDYWEKKFQEQQENPIYTPSIDPEFLTEEFGRKLYL